MLKYLKNLEKDVQVMIFFGGLLITFLGFSIKSYNNIANALIVINENQISLLELTKLRDITLSVYISDIYDEVVVKKNRNLTLKEEQLLTLYVENLKLNVEDSFKIKKILKKE